MVGAALAQTVSRDLPRWKISIGFAAMAILPDLDVIAFTLGIPYSHPYGHRGFTHGLLFACISSLLFCGILLWITRKKVRGNLWLFLAGFLAVSSHGILDAFTNKGLGIGFFTPFMENRYFAPFRPIGTAPLNVSGMLDNTILEILWTEFLWIWCPILIIFLLSLSVGAFFNKKSDHKEDQEQAGQTL